MPPFAVTQNTDYSSLSIQQIAETIKNARISKGYTQKELAELANINLRSLQRIENAKVKPRSYTLKQLEKFITLKTITHTPILHQRAYESSNFKKVILSIGCAVLFTIAAMAYVAQSVSFPETTFELLIFIGAITAFYMLILLRIWR